MTAPSYQRERAVAEVAVLRACTLTKQVQASVDKMSKTDSSPVTVADFAAQALIISAVHSAFPDDDFVGEEDAAALRPDAKLRQRVWGLVSSLRSQTLDDGTVVSGPASAEEMLDVIDRGATGRGGPRGRFWVMDPVDGTATFLDGQQYAVSLALIEDGREVVGVLGCPNLKLRDGRVEESSVDKHGLGIMLTAVRGQGATMRSPTFGGGLPPAQALKKLRSPPRLADVHVVDCQRSTAYRHEATQELARSFGARYPGTDVWSSLMRYAALIVGGADVQVRVPRAAGLRMTMHTWDHAGAQLIFTELGGRVTDVDGKDMDFGAGRDLDNNRGVVAARGDIHGVVLGFVQDFIAKQCYS